MAVSKQVALLGLLLIHRLHLNSPTIDGGSVSQWGIITTFSESPNSIVFRPLQAIVLTAGALPTQTQVSTLLENLGGESNCNGSD
jgi:hypothetical protein